MEAISNKMSVDILAHVRNQPRKLCLLLRLKYVFMYVKTRISFNRKLRAFIQITVSTKMFLFFVTVLIVEMHFKEWFIFLVLCATAFSSSSGTAAGS